MGRLHHTHPIHTSSFLYTPLMILRTLTLAAACVASTADAQSPEPTRRVEVHVTVTTNGAPFPEGTYVSMSGDALDVPTDANGRAVIVGEYPADTTTVLVDIPTIIAWGPPELLDLKNAAALSADKAFSLPPAKLVTLVPGQEVYRIEFLAPEAITVKGRTVDPTGKHLPVSAHRGGMFNMRFTLESDGGYFEVFGVPKEQDSFLFLGTNKKEEDVICLTASQTVADIDLGNVTVSESANNAAIEIAVSGRDAVREDMGMQRDMATLVRDDGRVVYQLVLTEASGVTHSPEGHYPDPPTVRPGRYYIVPGMSMTSDSSLKVLRLIRSGKLALLDAAGVPIIEPVTGQTTSSAIDLAAVQKIIDRLPESR